MATVQQLVPTLGYSKVLGTSCVFSEAPDGTGVSMSIGSLTLPELQASLTDKGGTSCRYYYNLLKRLAFSSKNDPNISWLDSRDIANLGNGGFGVLTGNGTYAVTIDWYTNQAVYPLSIFGLTNPLPINKVAEFAKKVSSLIVVR